MMTDEPTACLAGYTKQANLDPAQFNLSSTLGIERLKRFTLADPRLYVLNALAAAQSAPSRGLKIHCDADDMILTADTDVDFGPYLTDLSHRLLDEKCPPAVKELATAYHKFYDSCRVLPRGDEDVTETTIARLWLCAAARQTLANGLTMLGVTAPERM